MSTLPSCEECDAGTLHPSTWAADFRHGSGTVRVAGLECYTCDRCGADPVFTDQIRRNQRRIADARRHADKMLTGSDIHTLREQFGLTQQDAAALFGGGTNAFSKYERGDVIQSIAMDRLLKLVRIYPFLLHVLRELAGMAAASDALNQDYAHATQVSVNDPDYRSHAIRGTPVTVNMTDWQTSRAA